METQKHRPDLIDYLLLFNRIRILALRTEQGELTGEQFSELFRETSGTGALEADRDALDHDLLGTPGTPTGDLFPHQSGNR